MGARGGHLQREHPFDGVALAFAGDAVIAAGGVHLLVTHQLLEHLHRGPRVHVALGVGVTQGVREDPGRVETDGDSVGVSLEVQAALGVEPSLEQIEWVGPGSQLGRPGVRPVGAPPVLVALQSGEQDQLGHRRVGEPGPDRGLLLADQLGGVGVDRQPAAELVDLGHVVNQYRHHLGLTGLLVQPLVVGQAVEGQPAQFARPPADLQADLEPPAGVGGQLREVRLVEELGQHGVGEGVADLVVWVRVRLRVGSPPGRRRPSGPGPTAVRGPGRARGRGTRRGIGVRIRPSCCACTGSACPG